MHQNPTAMLAKLYDRDPDTGAYIIPVSVDVYADFFNEWDSAPFRRRDLDEALIRYLRDNSEDIPLREPVVLRIDIPRSVQDPSLEARVVAGLRNYFDFVLFSLDMDIRRSYSQALLHILVFFVFIATSFYVGEVMPEGVLTGILLEGLSVGGWVFLWATIERLVFRNQDIRRQIRIDRRLENAPLRFRYHD
jgi:hypothetical protein